MFSNLATTFVNYLQNKIVRCGLGGNDLSTVCRLSMHVEISTNPFCLIYNSVGYKFLIITIIVITINAGIGTDFKQDKLLDEAILFLIFGETSTLSFFVSMLSPWTCIGIKLSQLIEYLSWTLWTEVTLKMKRNILLGCIQCIWISLSLAN